MRKVHRPLVLLALVGVVASFSLTTSQPESSLAQTTSRPNIILILTDNQDVRSINRMPSLQEKLVNKGVLFTDSFTTTPVCCPSRASILRGQYPHNHGVLVAVIGS
jgi:N-acetylglucosamine-6-sulfatase